MMQSKKTKAGNDKSKYASIVEEISAKIRIGELCAGEKVPSENQIISDYGVSNTTARRVLSMLENLGLVRRIKGKGTLVLDYGKILTRAIGDFGAMKNSFSENLKRDGYAPDTKILERKILNGKISVQISKNIYELIGKIFKLRTLRYAEYVGDVSSSTNQAAFKKSKSPKILLKDEVFYFDAKQLVGVENFDDLDPIIPTLHKLFSMDITKIERSFTAQISNGESEELFGKSLPLVYMEGAILSDAGKLLVIEKSHYRADRYKFSIESRS